MKRTYLLTKSITCAKTYHSEATADVGVVLAEWEWVLNGRPTHAQAKREGHRAEELRMEREAREADKVRDCGPF